MTTQVPTQFYNHFLPILLTKNLSLSGDQDTEEFAISYNLGFAQDRKCILVPLNAGEMFLSLNISYCI